MTPSQWEQGKSPEHDLMQADVLEFLRRAGESPKPFLWNGKERQIIRVRTDCEVLIQIRGRIAGFCDVVDWWQEHEPKVSKPFRLAFVYEIKPRIMSAGAIVRQLKATEFLMEQSMLAGDIGAEIRIAPVVPADDPNLPALRRLWWGPVFPWDAEKSAFT